jgi:hypothetical protein
MFRWAALTAALTVALGLTLLLLGRRSPADFTPFATVPVTHDQPATGAGSATQDPQPPEAGRGSANSAWSVAARTDKGSLKTEVRRSAEGGNAKRTPPLKLARKPAAPPPPRLMDFHQLMATNQPLAQAWGRAATEDQPKAMPHILSCVDQLIGRRPEIREEGSLTGNLSVTLKVSGGQAQVIGIEGERPADQQFADCFARSSKWAREPMAAPGAKEGTVTVHWPYRFD